MGKQLATWGVALAILLNAFALVISLRDQPGYQPREVGVPSIENRRGIAIDGVTTYAALDVDQNSTGDIQRWLDAGTEIASIEDGGQTSFFAVNAAGGSQDVIDYTGTLGIMDGSDNFTLIDANVTSANHTGASNTVYGLDLDLASPDAQAEEYAIVIDDTDWDKGLVGAAGLEHDFFPSVATAAVTYTDTTDLFTAAAGWIVHGVLVEVTTNYDCTGDDCTVGIGDGNDANGLVDLVDAELQAADTEVTGGAAGWQGYLSGTRGAYLADGGFFVYDAADGIDFDIGGTSPAAGAMTVYLIYTVVK